MGLRGVIASLMLGLLVAVLLSISGLFLMFLLRRILRLQWLAAAVFVALIVANSAGRGESQVRCWGRSRAR